MTDSAESKSERFHNSILSKLADDDYLYDKIISMKQRRKLSKSEINYIIKNAEKKTISADTTEIDNIIKQAVNIVVAENEEDIYNQSITEKAKIDFTESILNTDITKNNFEEIFCLKDFKAIELPTSSDENIRSIRYKDKDGTILAIAQINTDSNKLRLQTFGEILPKQEFIKPQQVNYRIMSKSKANNWVTEYGGVNQFDGSIEIRYKNEDGDVMAAVIFKSDGNVDTVVEYMYKNRKKIQMFHTSQYGHSKTIYDDVNDITKLIVDIDTDGNICCVTKCLT